MVIIKKKCSLLSGFDLHTQAYKKVDFLGIGHMPPSEQEKILRRVVTDAPSLPNRKLRIYSDFHHTDNMAGMQRITFINLHTYGVLPMLTCLTSCQIHF